jgi:hypothetical protein
MMRVEGGCSLARVIVLVVACFLPLACNRSGSPDNVYPVRGEVFFKGQPATGAAVHFHPLEGEECTAAFAIVKDDGSFEMSTFGNNDGAEPGNYAVTINWRKEERVDDEVVTSPDRLGERYSKADTSGLKVTVTEGKNVVPRYDLKD